MWPTWLQVGLQNRAKIDKSRCKNRSKNRCLSRSIFEAILVDFGKENGGKLAPKSIKNRCQVRKAIFEKSCSRFSGGSIFEVLGVEVGSKTIKNRSKNEVNMGRHLGIDFSSILVDFGSQVGVENRPKIDPKRHRKSDEKKKATKIAKKSLQDPATYSGRSGPGSGKGVGGRVNPSPKEGRKGIEPV